VSQQCCGFLGDDGAVVDHGEGDDERVRGVASAALLHQIRIELRYLPDTLLHRRIGLAEPVAFASAHCLAVSGVFKRGPFGSGKLRQDQSRRSV
jgi:hypothetical protein